MAECPENSAENGEKEAAAAPGIPAGLVLGQSKSKSESFQEFGDLDPETVGAADKNGVFLVCRSCRCKVLKPGYGKLVDKEIFLPSMTDKYNIGSEPTGDTITRFWLVSDMFHFENLGFSKTVDGKVKYLICADCERGPIGWHSLDNRTEYLIAAERVQYCSS